MKLNPLWLRLFFSHLKEVVFHELLHSTGFSKSTYRNYYIVGNTPRASLTYGFILKQTDSKGNKSFYVASPGVMEVLKKINPELPGAQLQTYKNKEIPIGIGKNLLSRLEI
jgi:hypothetical protein